MIHRFSLFLTSVFSPTLRGLIWVALAGLTFVIFTAIVRYVSAELHPVQSAFIRYAFGIVVLTPFFIRHGLGLLRTENIGLQATRGCVHGIGVMLWFFAASRIPVTDVMALSFTSPLFVTIGAGLFLGEVLNARRIVAVLVGFVGVLIILRPGFTQVEVAAIALLLAAPLFAVSKLITKVLVRDDSSATIVAYLSIFATVTMLVPALFVWQVPSVTDLSWLAGTALFATLSHLCMARGLVLIDVVAAQPVAFLQLVWATLLGITLFGEYPDVWVWIGAAVIVVSATYALLYEASNAN